MSASIAAMLTYGPGAKKTVTHSHDDDACCITGTRNTTHTCSTADTTATKESASGAAHVDQDTLCYVIDWHSQSALVHLKVRSRTLSVLD